MPLLLLKCKLSRLHESHLSSVSEGGFDGLQGGELKGVPVSVSLELSRWLLSREIRLELPPFELRFKSAMLCSEGRHRWTTIMLKGFTQVRGVRGSPSSSSAQVLGEGRGWAASFLHALLQSSSHSSTCWCCWPVGTLQMAVVTMKVWSQSSFDRVLKDDN